MDAGTISLILGVALAISEGLALIPQIKSNSIFQLIYNLLHNFKPMKLFRRK